MNLPNNWKSTASGMFSLIYVVCLAISGFLALQPNLSQNKYYIYAMFIVGLVAAVSKAVVGFFTKDAGSTLAEVPGSSTPVSVPSHEVPDTGDAKVVLPEKP